MSKYLLIQASEDGNPVCWLTDEQVKNIPELMEDYMVTEWVEDMTDPNYWPEGKAMLLKYEVANPKKVNVVVNEEWQLP